MKTKLLNTICETTKIKLKYRIQQGLIFVPAEKKEKEKKTVSAVIPVTPLLIYTYLSFETSESSTIGYLLFDIL